MREKYRRLIKKVVIPVLFLLVVGILAMFLVTGENLSQMAGALLGADYKFVFMAVGIYFFGLSLWATRWKVALAANYHQVRLRTLFMNVLGSVFVNNITPFTYSGGDPVARTYILKKTTDAPYTCGIAAVISEFVFDFPIFLSLFMLGLILWGTQVPMLILIAVWFAIISLFLTLVYLITHKETAPQKLTGFIWRIAKKFKKTANREKIAAQADSFVAAVRRIVRRRGCVLTMVPISLLFWGMVITRFLLVFLALGYQPQLPMLMLMLTLASVVGLIPLLPGGLGTVDVTYLSVFAIFGVPTHIALSAVLVERLVSFVLGTIAGATALSYLGLRLWIKPSSSLSREGNQAS